MQNKPYFFFFWKQGFPKGGEGGSDTWELFPKNPVFFFGWRPYGGANKLLISFGMKCDTDRASHFDSLCWAAMKSAIIGKLASQSPGSSSVAVISHGKSGKSGR